MKKLGKAILFPPLAIMWALVPLAAVLLVGSMTRLSKESPAAIASYVLSAYTLTVWCLRFPHIMRRFKAFKDENRYVRKWRDDARLRVKVSLWGSLAFNGLYGTLQLGLGFYHRTFWFSSLGIYYMCLAVMRFFLVRHTGKYAPGERMRSELLQYCACGWALLLMNAAVSVILFFMVYWSRSFQHSMITAIAMAAYTFAALAVAIVNVIQYKKYRSPVFSATQAISLAAALVSLLILESTMLTTFGDGTVTASGMKWMLGTSGGIVSLVMIATAISMIAIGRKRLKQFK